ncbi:MAG: thymidylate synthase [Candidatus Omnitrophica bacterium]|nr:thymidylate synthase [Candidatus Omnitrophota bacterium]
MKQYLDLVRHVLTHGEEKKDRTGTGTISVFGYQTKYDLREGFPLVTTKKALFDAVVRELLWFLRGATNVNDGLKAFTPIWNAWANEAGELGPIYGYQWRKWEKFVWDEKSKAYRKEHIDQILQVIEMIKKSPDSRRLIVSAWNVADIDKMALPPCHSFFQFYVVNGRLDCQLYQRSADIALGVPFNIASYALLLSMVANECRLTPGIFVHTLGDAHIYLNHVDGLKEQLQRAPKALPKLELADKNVLDYQFEDIKIIGYEHYPFIKFPIAV